MIKIGRCRGLDFCLRLFEKIRYLILLIKCRVLDRRRPVEGLACVDTHLWREDHRFTTALIFPQQVEEANSISWQNSGTFSIQTRKERIDQKPSHATIPFVLLTFLALLNLLKGKSTPW
jgi:hypothetical protein